MALFNLSISLTIFILCVFVTTSTLNNRIDDDIFDALNIDKKNYAHLSKTEDTKVTNLPSKSNNKRKRNRLSEESEFEADTKPTPKKKQSKYKNVYFHQSSKQYWIPRVHFQHKYHNFGCFQTEEEAARAVNKKCKEFGIKEKNPEYLFDESYVKTTKYKSKFKCLSLHNSHAIHWLAVLYIDKKMLRLGYFKNEKDAARAVDKKCMELGMEPLNRELLFNESRCEDRLNLENLEGKNVLRDDLDTKLMYSEIFLENVDANDMVRRYDNGVQQLNPDSNQYDCFDDTYYSYDFNDDEESSFEDEDILQAQAWRQKWDRIRLSCDQQCFRKMFVF